MKGIGAILTVVGLLLAGVQLAALATGTLISAGHLVVGVVLVLAGAFVLRSAARG
jgi:hypothetical protein